MSSFQRTVVRSVECALAELEPLHRSEHTDLTAAAPEPVQAHSRMRKPSQAVRSQLVDPALFRPISSALLWK